MACHNLYSHTQTYGNTFIDDSTLQLYIPKTLLDSSTEQQGIFDYYGYALMQHYGYWYLNKSFKSNDIKILFYDGVERNNVSDTLLDQLLLKQVSDIKESEGIETFVSLDTTRIEKHKMGMVRKVVGCGNDALYVTSCFISCPERSRIYYIHISCDKSKPGYMLRDSIPLIINLFT